VLLESTALAARAARPNNYPTPPAACLLDYLKKKFKKVLTIFILWDNMGL